MKEKFSLKDHLFNEDKVRYLATLLVSSTPNFREEDFVREVMSRMLQLELKARIVWITEVLERYLSEDFDEACKVVVAALPPPLNPTLSDDDFGDFIFASLGEYVVRNGCTQENLKLSLQMIEELTQRFSMEDALRAFLNKFPRETLKQCNVWITHPNYHVRRLVSEGTRPLLPWSRRVALTAADTTPFLDVLYADKTRYVTRSVANHLNDISKNEAQLVVDTLGRWRGENKQEERELAWLTKHALRTLIKQGNTAALCLLGYDAVHGVKVERFYLIEQSSKITPGETIAFACTLTSSQNTKLLIDYVIDFVKGNNGTKPKVFKWKQLTLKAGEEVMLKKSHYLKAEATTFRLYAGQHTITLQINGQKLATIDFMLQ